MGEDLGNVIFLGWCVMLWFIDLYGILFGGVIGKWINGVGFVLFFLLIVFGFVFWWFGI